MWSLLTVVTASPLLVKNSDKGGGQINNDHLQVKNWYPQTNNGQGEDCYLMGSD